MFNIGFALDSDSSELGDGLIDVVGHIFQGIRSLFAIIDTAIYTLVVIIYQILFNIADATIFSSATIKSFYGRVQLIIGVFMIFKLSISLLQTIVNPDSMSEKNGVGKLITRIMVMLAMFTAIIPLNIPLTSSDIQKKTYNYYLEQSGLLFGTMYSLQSRILKGNVIGKLVLGDEASNYDSHDENGSDNIEDAANELAIFMLKGFVRINLQEKYSGAGGKIDSSKYMCKNFSSSEQSQIDRYNNAKSVLDVLNVNNITEWCDAYDGGSDNRWMFVYTPLVPTVCGIFLLIVLVSYCVECAIRALKLAILRLLAPIPIISYVDPKSSEGGAFSSYMKILGTTYIDLFLRLAIIYFIIFLVREITSEGLDIPIANGVIGIISTIFIIIGMFFFAKEAPKFIKQSLGIKDEGGSGLFSGLGKITGFGAAVGGAVGSAMTNYRASSEEGGHRRLSAMVGGISGLATGLRAAATAEDHSARAVREAQQKRNALRASHSTLPGRVADNAVSMFTGKSLADRDQQKYDTSKEAFSSLKDYKAMLQEQAGKRNDYYGTATINGQKRLFNYEGLKAAMNAKDQNGNFQYHGRTYNVADFGQNTLNEIQDTQSEAYRKDWQAGKVSDPKLSTQWRNTEYLTKQADISVPVDYNDIGRAIGDANSNMADMTTDMKHIQRRANYQANKNK